MRAEIRALTRLIDLYMMRWLLIWRLLHQEMTRLIDKSHFSDPWTLFWFKSLCKVSQDTSASQQIWQPQYWQTKETSVRQPSVNSFSPSMPAMWREDQNHRKTGAAGLLWDRKQYALVWPCKVFPLIKKIGTRWYSPWQAWKMQFFFKKTEQV